MARQVQLVQRHPREVVEQRAEAGGGQVVCGAVCGGLQQGGFRLPGPFEQLH